MSDTTSSTLQIRIVDSESGLHALRDDWRTLSQSARSACPFNSWCWHSVWWSVFKTRSCTLQIWTVSDNNRLVALLPMYKRYQGPVRGQALRFIGTGEALDDEVATEYSDILIVPEYEQQVLPLVVQWLTSFTQWSHVDLRCVLQQGLLAGAINRFAEPAYRTDRNTGYRYRIPLNSQHDLVEIIAGKKIRRVRRSLRSIERDGGLQRHSASEEGAAEYQLSTLVRLNHQRQQKKQRRSSFDSEKFLEFHRQLLHIMMPQSLADVHVFSIANEPVAALYCFYSKDTSYYYQSGFETRSANRYMPLLAAHINEAQRARSTGRRFYDLMRAEPPTYKADIASDVAALTNINLFKRATGFWRYKTLWFLRRQLVARLNSVGISRRR